MTLWHQLAGLLPFEWAQFEFMRQALLAVLLVAPVFALLGCMVVNNQMAFFSEALGHAALTGIALGALAGLADPLWAMILFAAALTLALAGLRRRSAASMDTLIGLVMACAVALGVALLSRGGGFNKYSRYLVGDILTITPPEIGRMALMAGAVAVVWLVFFNRIFLVSLSPSLARSRGIRAGRIELLFALVVALVVTISIQWVGLLVINAMLLLPAAAARNLARHTAGYVGWAVVIGLAAGLAGLVTSYYADTATGATIVLYAAAVYGITLIPRRG